MELEHVDAIVAAGTGPDQVVLRDVAGRHPGVVFLPVVHGPREATLHRSAPNVFRFAGDDGQGVAGRSPTRTAISDGGGRPWHCRIGTPAGRAADVFVAEFCAWGGKVEDQLGRRGRSSRRAATSSGCRATWTALPCSRDSSSRPAGFLERLARSVDDPARQIVAGPALMDDAALLGATSPALQGVTGTSYRDPSLLRSYLREYRSAFPGVPAAVAGGELVTVTAMPWRRSSGHSSAPTAARSAFRPSGRLQPELLGGPVSLDSRGQAVVTTSIVRIGLPANGAPEPALTRLSRVRGVDQSIGGLLSPSLRPEHRPSSCTRGRPPPWAGGGAG